MLVINNHNPEPLMEYIRKATRDMVNTIKAINKV